MSGRWSNNTQGVGGNVAPLILTNMKVGLASNGNTRIAYPTHDGSGYADSFAFVPGFGANQFCEAVIYKQAGYNPNATGSNHEVELLLGCRSASGYRIWNEFLLNASGGVEIVYLDGGASAFTSIGSPLVLATPPNDGDVVRATKVGNTLNMYINGNLVCTYTGSMIANGSGIGVAVVGVGLLIAGVLA